MKQTKDTKCNLNQYIYHFAAGASRAYPKYEVVARSLLTMISRDPSKHHYSCLYLPRR